MPDPIAVSPSLTGLVEGNPFVSYVYSYPHKTAHRPLAPPVPLREAWAEEPCGSLFVYFHVPFCESRCGFCNLFSLAGPAPAIPDRYLEQLRHQAERARRALDETPRGRGARFARLAIGGGTPTFLSPDQLRALLAIATDVLGANPQRIPVSVEASPGTVSEEKLALLREFGVDRLSLGVQTFDRGQARALGRVLRDEDVEHALAAIRQAGFPVLNLDLIYGIPHQDVERWLDTVRQALRYRPEELYLYPLYVRPMTRLGRDGCSAASLDHYRAARELLIEHGYHQLSLRFFRSPAAPQESGPAYRCQEDGMVGLGCGARSYTRRLHYSTPYAVPRRAVQAVLEEFLRRPAEAFDWADHGIVLDEEDQRRRYAILSLLQADGVSRPDYAARFGSDVLDELPQLIQLQSLGLAEVDRDGIRLTAAGLERSDAIGPWLFSQRVRRLMESYPWRTA